MAQKSTQMTKDDLQKRVLELERENTQLRKKVNATKLQVAKKGTWKSWLSYFLLVIASFGVISSLNSIWVRNTLLDTPTWVESTTAIIQNENVRQDIASLATDAIYDEIDLEQTVTDLLPERTELLAVPISSQIRSNTEELLNEFLASEEFIELWQELNTVAHQAIVTTLETANQLSAEENRDNVLYISQDTLYVNLLPVINTLKSELRANGLDFIPEDTKVNPDKLVYPVAEIKNLDTILTIYNTIDTARYIIPAITALLLLGGVVLSRNRRAALLFVSLLVFALAAVNLIAIQLPGFEFSGNTAVGITANSSEAMYTIIVSSIQEALRVVLAVSLVIGLLCYLAGPSKLSVSCRSAVISFVKNYQSNRVVKFVATNAVFFAGIITVAGLILLASISYSSLLLPMVIVLVCGVLIILLLALSRDLKK